jgi:hypothetical protein
MKRRSETRVVSLLAASQRVVLLGTLAGASACSLLVGGEDKILVEADEPGTTRGRGGAAGATAGAAGDGTAGVAGALTAGGASGETAAGSAGSAGAGIGGAGVAGAPMVAGASGAAGAAAGAAGTGVAGAGGGGGTTAGGSAGQPGAGAAGTAGEAGAGGSAGAGASAGAAGTSAGGVAGASAGAGGDAGSGDPGGGAGANAGTGGVGPGGAAGSTTGYTAPGQLDCETPPELGASLFCTDFSPAPGGWAPGGCVGTSTDPQNPTFVWQADAGQKCSTFVEATQSAGPTSVTLSFWVKITALGIADVTDNDRLDFATVKTGTNPGVTIGVRPMRNMKGVITGTTVLLRTAFSTETRDLGPLPLNHWKHLRVSAGFSGGNCLGEASYGETSVATDGGSFQSIPSTVACAKGGPSSFRLVFEQYDFPDGLTRVEIDDVLLEAK